VASQLNDIGIEPGGAVIKEHIRQDLRDMNVQPDPQEIALMLSGMIAEKALNQEDVNRLARHAKIR